MRYIIMSSGRGSAAGHERGDLNEAVALAIEFMTDKPGSITYISDTVSGKRYEEAEIRHLAASLPGWSAQRA